MGASLSRGRSDKAEKKSFKWRIDGFSSLVDRSEGWTYSGVFEIKGLNWYLKLNPMDRKSGDARPYVSLRLELARTSVRSDSVVQADFKFLIYDHSYGKHSEHQGSHHFQTASTTSGISCIIPLETLKKSSSGFLVNDSCIFGVEFIKINTVKTSAASESLFVQKNNTRESYTWNIKDLFELKKPACSSPAFEIGGRKWFLTIHPSGAGSSKNFLSLYLNLDKSNKLPRNSGILVEVSLSIKDQENDKHKKLTGRCQFSEKSSGWGWPKFISLEEFKDSSKGYLVKTKCSIEAEIAIIGSSNEE